MTNTYPLVDLCTARSLALLAAAYPAEVAAACRRQEPVGLALGGWDGPVDPETERIMQAPPVAPERRVA